MAAAAAVEHPYFQEAGESLVPGGVESHPPFGSWHRNSNGSHWLFGLFWARHGPCVEWTARTSRRDSPIGAAYCTSELLREPSAFSFFGLSTESMVRKACDIRNWCFLMGSSFKALFGNSHLPKTIPFVEAKTKSHGFPRRRSHKSLACFRPSRRASADGPRPQASPCSFGHVFGRGFSTGV